ncbi:MAG: hypothetical protein GQ569_11475 [Methylococcaceae bacterium]|nr:hypothetical protein [Methylococcaceae bacterium]
MAIKQKQAGYLLEVPLILMLTAMILAIFLPILSEIPFKLLSLIAAPIFIACFYYMIVTPGWQPNPSTLSRRGRLISFFGMSALVIFITVVYLFQ